MGKAQTMGWVMIAAVLFIAVLPMGFCTGGKRPTKKSGSLNFYATVPFKVIIDAAKE
jgi:hypothetical protein